MSDEEEGKIEKTFIDTLGAKYPMVKIKPGDTQKYGIKFYQASTASRQMAPCIRCRTIACRVNR